MRKLEFYAVILAGGGGERFWPLSTPKRPKQFLKIFGGKSLIRQTAERLHGLVTPERTIVITSRELVKATRAELPEIPRGNIAAEPCRRDTAAAMACACAMVRRLGGERAVAVVLSADQLISRPAAFRRVIADAATAARSSDCIVTVGIRPDRPATGFGYIAPGRRAQLGVATPVFKVARFAEKPDERTARRYLRAGYMWNGGIFAWSAATLRALLARHAPELADLESHLAIARSIPAALKRLYPPLPRISFDYAILEKTDRILMAAGAFGWDDVGSWTALGHHFEADEHANIIRGDATVEDVAGSVVFCDGGPRIAVMGMKDVIVVSTPGNVLVCAKGRAQELKKLVAKLNA